jgi:hypothetical protein
MVQAKKDDRVFLINFFDFESEKNRSRITKFHLGVPIKKTEPFVIKKERWFHPILIKMGLTNDLKTGSKKIDKHLFFTTSSPPSLKKFLYRKEVLNAIDSLFSKYGFSSLYCFHGKLWGKFALVEGESTLQIDSRLKLLEIIAKELNKESSKSTPLPFLHSLKLPTLFMAFHAALFIFIFIMGTAILFETKTLIFPNQLLHFGLIIGILLSILWCTIIIYCLSGTSWFPLVISDFFLFGIAGIIFTIIFGVREANFELDTKPVKQFQQVLLAKNCSLKCVSKRRKSNKSTTYPLNAAQCSSTQRMGTLSQYKNMDYKCRGSAYFIFHLTLEPWLPGQENNFEFVTSSTVFDHSAVGMPMIINTHPGAFGFTWVDTLNIRPEIGSNKK